MKRKEEEGRDYNSLLDKARELAKQLRDEGWRYSESVAIFNLAKGVAIELKPFQVKFEDNKVTDESQ